MKVIGLSHPYADPDVAARKIMEIANSLEPYMDGRLLIELMSGPMLFREKTALAKYKAGPDRCIEKG